ncbi:MAG: type IV pilus modification protein PilV [Cellvibrio sp.]|jgi:type IV pilus assembly protein PilV
MTSITKHQNGASLIEVLVTVLILATSLLAIAALQTRSLDYNHSAFLRSQANIIAYDILDRMRINSPISGAVVEPDEDERAAMVTNLPDGKAEVDCAGRVCTVTITWAEQDGLDEDGDTSTFTYTTRI